MIQIGSYIIYGILGSVIVILGAIFITGLLAFIVKKFDEDC